MKAKFLNIIAIAALMLSACGESEKPQKLSDIEKATVNDSVGYYIGQVMSFNYWRAAAASDTMNTQDYKDSYVKGMQAGLKMATADDAFNKGLLDGLQTALSIKSFDETFMTQVNKKSLIKGLVYGLQSDTIVDRRDHDMNFNKIMQNLEYQKEQRDKQALDSLIKENVNKNGFKHVADMVSKTVITENGKALVEGDTVSVLIKFTDVDGNVVAPTSQEPTTMIVGKFPYSQFVNKALRMMKEGDETEFLGSAFDVFGFQMPPQSNLSKFDLVKLTMKVMPGNSEEQTPGK